MHISDFSTSLPAAGLFAVGIDLMGCLCLAGLRRAAPKRSHARGDGG
jgi:hypothetical protein